MIKKKLSSIFHPGQRGKLRWTFIAIVALFVVTSLANVIGVVGPVARSIDQSLSAVPNVNVWPVWPIVVTNPIDSSKSIVWRNIQEVDLEHYGRNFSLGLDLLGGTHLVYQADVSGISSAERADSLAGVRDVIERRVNTLGVSEPLVQTNQSGDDWRVVVELAGVYDVNQAIQMIGETPLLEFKIPSASQPELTAEQTKMVMEDDTAVKAEAQGVLDQIKKGANMGDLAIQYTDDEGSKATNGYYAGVKPGMFVPEYDQVLFEKMKVGEVYPELVRTQFGYHIVKKENERGTGDSREADTRHILFATKSLAELGVSVDPEWKSTPLTGKNLKTSSVQSDPTTGVINVGLEFDDEGTKLFADITKAQVGQQVAIFLDGEAISMPTVNEPILDGRAMISGNFTLADAKTLSQRLNAGALPVPIDLISQTTVGASLGNESITKSLIAGLWGFLAVALFMIIYYRLPGLLSVLALLVYVTLVLFVFKMLPVTLTLAGIAGFVLSIGMAVDANVLIFERMKEELRNGRDISFSIKEGFQRAWNSIFDSNVSSLITCTILFWFGTSIIRGFALTLALGIIVSMFSAIVITRTFLRLIGGWSWLRHPWLYGVKAKNN